MTEITKLGANHGADYYRVTDGERSVSVRFSVLYPVPPLCLTCVKFNCVHAELVAEYLEQQQPAPATEHAA